jgi:predicted Holliday junction resolvase-like endonuclease
MLVEAVVGVLGAAVVVLAFFLYRARSDRQLDGRLLQAKDQSEGRLLEENRYYRELFELGDASYKESQGKIQELLSQLGVKDIILTQGSLALENANTNLKKLLAALSEKDGNIKALEEALTFQQGQYSKLLGQKKSSEVRTGKITEQIAPFLADYPLNPRTARFIGDPIDFVHFDDDKVTFVEVKSGRSQLSKKQRNIRDLIAEGKVNFQVYRVKGDDDGTSGS